MDDQADGGAPVAVEQHPVPTRAGRHAATELELRRPTTDGRRVLIVGGGSALDEVLIDRLTSAGHAVALHTAADERRGHRHRSTEAPTLLTGDRADSDDIIYGVTAAEIALGGLDVIVITPDGHESTADINADSATWARSWSTALATDVLAAACAAHAAARSFITGRRAGRIVLVAPDSTAVGGVSSATEEAVCRSAITALGAGLARELQPHGIGVSVVTAAIGGAVGGFAIAQVADVVEALLATPVLSGVDAVIG